MRWQSARAGILQVTALAAVLSLGGIHEASRQTCLTNIANGDFWWHLRVGLGILQTQAVPHFGLYSQASPLPWMASSWLYDVVIAIGYRMMGLRIVLLTAILFRFALAFVVFVLAGGFRGRFWIAIVLSLLAQYILGNLQPLPLCYSILALSIELALLTECHTACSVKPLYWLPCLFLLWANVDVEFVCGVIALMLFAASCCINAWVLHPNVSAGARTETLSLKRVGVLTVMSLAATVVTPYGWSPYATFFSQVTSAANSYLPNYQSLRFRTPQDYVLLLLIMTAFLALGMRRSRDPFQIGLLVFMTMIGFRAQRDLWLPTLAAIATLANAIPQSNWPTVRASAWRGATSAGVALTVLLLAMKSFGPSDNEAALARMDKRFPVAAADYIRERHLPQPLFNSYQWGGFLIWYLPEYPVAVDARSDLYGADFDIQYAKVMNADAHYSTFAPLNQARTILLEKDSLMGEALSNVAGFTVAYSDDVAVVLLRQEQQQ